MNPLQVIRSKSLENWSGCIQIEDPQDPCINWLVYLLEGRIQYVSTSQGEQIRLNYLWQRFRIGINPPKVPASKKAEYSELIQYFISHEFSDEYIHNILFNFVREGLTHIATIEHTKVVLIPGRRIKSSHFYVNLPQLKLKNRIKVWQPIRNYLGTPFRRIYLPQENALKFYQSWKARYNHPHLKSLSKSIKLSSFMGLFVGKKTLYEIATKADTRAYLLGIFLKQSIMKKSIEVLPFEGVDQIDALDRSKIATSTKIETNQFTYNKSSINLKITKESTLIVCVDDSKTVQKQVKMTLTAVGYRVMQITDPIGDMNKLFKSKPALIFMDINMPGIDGYELCHLLRKSSRFQQIPIVMLTGRDGMVDRMRAKFVGATDYLTKPCDPHKLISLVTMLQDSNQKTKSSKL